MILRVTMRDILSKQASADESKMNARTGCYNSVKYFAFFILFIFLKVRI